MAIEIKDFEPVEPSSTLCVENTLLNYTPRIMPMAPIRGFEEKYLGDEITEYDERRTPVIPSVYARVQEKNAQVLERHAKSPIKQDEVWELFKEADQEKDTVGFTLAQRADDLHIAQTHTPTELAPKLKYPENLMINMEAIDKDHPRNLWDIYETSDGKPVLAIPDVDKFGATNLKTVDIDELHKLDPEAVQEGIRTYHTASSFSYALLELIGDLRSHEVKAEEIVPHFLQHIVHTESPITEMLGYAILLNYLSNANHDLRDEVGRFSRRLDYIKSEKHNSVYLQSWLEHMSHCPDQTEVLRDQTEQAFLAFTAFRNYDFRSEVPDVFGDTPRPDLMQVLAWPLHYNPMWIDMEEEKVRTERSEDVEMQVVLEKSADIPVEELPEIIKENAPQMHELLEWFQEWLGLDYLNKENFERLVDGTASTILFPHINVSGSNFGKEIDRELYLARQVGAEKFPGIYETHIDHYKPHFSEGILKDIVTVFAIKKAQQNAHQDKFDIPLTEKQRMDKLSALSATLEQMTKRYEAKVATGDNELMELNEKRERWHELLDMAELSVEDINKMVKDTFGDFSKESRRHRDFTNRYNSFVIALNSIVLSGAFGYNHHSPAFRAFLQEVFPMMDVDILNAMQKIE